MVQNSIDSNYNNSSSGNGLFVAGSATVGGVSGAGIGFSRKKFIKDGIPTDSFVKKAIEAAATTPEKQEKLVELQKLEEHIKNYDNLKDAQEFKDFVNKSGKFKWGLRKRLFFKRFDRIVKKESFEEAKKRFRDKLDITDYEKDIQSTYKHVKDTFLKLWDRNNNCFLGKSEVKKNKEVQETLKVFKKVANKFRTKGALVGGGIGATVSGILASLLLPKKQTSQPPIENN